ncbi:MAG: putative motility protein [Pirellulaceae bacterium]|nr:putative motility protein [Planctomycetales bacterium]
MSISAIVSAASAIQQTKIETQISYAVAGKQLDAVEQQGEAAVELLEAAVELHKSSLQGNLIDVRA